MISTGSTGLRGASEVRWCNFSTGRPVWESRDNAGVADPLIQHLAHSMQLLCKAKRIPYSRSCSHHDCSVRISWLSWHLFHSALSFDQLLSRPGLVSGLPAELRILKSEANLSLPLVGAALITQQRPFPDPKVTQLKRVSKRAPCPRSPYSH